MPEAGALLFWLSTGLVFHSYVLFPAQMRTLRRLPAPPPVSGITPDIDILLAVWNEAEVIERKIRSTFATTYPGKISLYIGTDACTDTTDQLIEKLRTEFPAIIHERFTERTGKPGILNVLQQKATAEILVMTDADAFFQPDTLQALIAPFSDERVGGVQADVKITTEASNEVALQEARYTYREMEIKQGESRLGSIIGAFGAAYALRKSCYRNIPNGFIVDDFFLFMEVLRQGYVTVYAQEARYELLLSGDAQVQFRRKRRIGKGNFQNLLYFSGMLFRLNRTAYCFWSHKVLRWLTPLLLAAAWLGTLLAAPGQVFYAGISWFIGLLITAALIDHWLLVPRGIKVKGLRFLSHFLLMNVALLLGLKDLWQGDNRSHWSNRG